MFIDADAGETIIAAYLEKNGVADWTPTASQKAIIAQCFEDAYITVLAALIGQHGLTRAQADTWMLGKKFQRDIAFFWAMKKLGFYMPVEVGAKHPLDVFNREDELLNDDLPLALGAGTAATDSDRPGFAVINLDE